MNQGAAVWLLIVFALLAANLTFASNRLLWFGPKVHGRKPAYWHVLELLLGYVMAGLLGLALERRGGQISSQGWEFYVITTCLFLVFATPGFIYRYLIRRGG